MGHLKLSHLNATFLQAGYLSTVPFKRGGRLPENRMVDSQITSAFPSCVFSTNNKFFVDYVANALYNICT